MAARVTATPGRWPARAMVFEAAGAPLRVADVPDPAAGPGQLLLRVHACGVCRTDLHLLDGEVDRRELAARPRPPDRRGVDGATGPARVGVPVAGLDLRRVRATAARAARTSATARALHRLRHRRRLSPSTRSPTSASASRSRTATPTSQAAPLLCAGLIGYRALRMCGDARAARPLRLRRRRAHPLPGRALHQGRRVFAFTRAGRRARRRRSRASSAPSGPAASDEPPPEPLDAAIIFAPVGALVPAALRAVAPGRHASSAAGST